MTGSKRTQGRRMVAKACLLLVVAWMTMLMTHELGHIFAGYASGATLVAHDLAPWRLPYCIHAPDPHPDITLWGGPILGVALPIGLACLWKRDEAALIGNFCLLANGCYIAVGFTTDDRWVDTPRMLEAGVPQIHLIAYCFATIPLGYLRFRSSMVGLLTEPTDRQIDESGA